jgi:hypothetical protein
MKGALEVMDKYPDLSWGDKIAIVAARLKWLEKEFPPPEAPLSHSFKDGMYVRSMKIPADTVFIGRQHLKGHEVHLIKGRAIYITPKGKFEVQAPFSVHTAPGFYMIAYIIEEVEVESWHPNKEESRDIDKIEKTYFEPPELLIARGQLLEKQLWLASQPSL